MKRTVHLPIHIPTLLFAGVAVGLYISFTQFVFAQQGGNQTTIYACVNNTGGIRIITENTTCNSNETALDWPKEASNNGFPFTCPGCIINGDSGLDNRFKNKDFTKSYLAGAKFINADVSGSIFKKSNLYTTRFENSNLQNADFDNVVLNSVEFINSNLSNSTFRNGARGPASSSNIFTSSTGINVNFKNADASVIMNQVEFTNANFTEAIFELSDFNSASIISSNFSNTSLKGANFGMANLTGSNFTNANLTISSISNNSTSFQDANLTNVNYTSSNLLGATGIETAIRTGIIWSNTTCPDGTNSDSNGNTCEGHLNP